MLIVAKEKSGTEEKEEGAEEAAEEEEEEEERVFNRIDVSDYGNPIMLRSHNIVILKKIFQ